MFPIEPPRTDDEDEAVARALAHGGGMAAIEPPRTDEDEAAVARAVKTKRQVRGGCCLVHT